AGTNVTLSAGSTSGAVTISAGTTAPNGTLTLTAGPTGSVNVNNGITASGSKVDINTPTLSVQGTGSTISSTAASGGGIDIQSTTTASTGLLTINMDAGTILNAGNNGIRLNPTAAGQIAMSSGSGDVTANTFGVNGGSNAVNINANSISCCVSGLGAGNL